ncbi:TRM11 family SAM-dependent methyltransferase [Actinocorallia longicatena]|uniref:Methyltransferase n=1 Tax=Actinocorallia longicatena TaxID=111803 RepID=A0ABP6QPE5_9ACTN
MNAKKLFLPSVLTIGQRPSRTQRAGRYTEESMKHPAKMLPDLAAEVIGSFTKPGELVLDPMCGIGTTLVESLHLGRSAVGMEYEPDFARMAADNLAHARARGAKGEARVMCGDSRNIASTLASYRGEVSLVLTSPPYGASTHGHVKSFGLTGDAGVTKENHRYSTDKRNLAHRPRAELLGGFGQILSGSASLLRPFGVVAVTIRPIRVKGELIDLPGLVIDTAHEAGLVLTNRLAALLCGVRDGELVNRTSFFQRIETKRARAKGLPACATAHEDLLIFQTAADLKEVGR